MAVANTPSKKAHLLCPNLPPKPLPALTKLIDSLLWLANIVNLCDPHVEQGHGHRLVHCRTKHLKIASSATKPREHATKTHSVCTQQEPKKTSNNRWKPPRLSYYVEPNGNPTYNTDSGVGWEIMTHDTEISPKKRKRVQANNPHSEKHNKEQLHPKSWKSLDHITSRDKNFKNRRTAGTRGKTDPPAIAKLKKKHLGRTLRPLENP